MFLDCLHTYSSKEYKFAPGTLQWNTSHHQESHTTSHCGWDCLWKKQGPYCLHPANDYVAHRFRSSLHTQETAVPRSTCICHDHHQVSRSDLWSCGYLSSGTCIQSWSALCGILTINIQRRFYKIFLFTSVDFFHVFFYKLCPSFFRCSSWNKRKW